MTARTHDVAALALLMTSVIVFPPGNITVATVLAALFANQLGGIAPDIDQPTAPFWRNLPVGRLLGKIFAVLVGGHRFICHSIIGVGLFAIASHLFLEFIQPTIPRIDVGFVWIAFMIGVVSHLIMDTFTKEGVPYLLPLPIKFGFPPIKAWRITTGKKVETLIILPLLIVLVIWLSSVNYNLFTEIIREHFVK